MKASVPGASLSQRIKSQVENIITSSGRSQIIKTNSGFELPATSVKENIWSAKYEIKNKDNILNNAKAMGADYIVLVTGGSREDPFYGTSTYIDNIGVSQRSILGLTRSNSYALITLIALDTKTKATASTNSIFVKHSRAGKPWISPNKLPSGAQVEEILSELNIQSNLKSALNKMGF